MDEYHTLRKYRLESTWAACESSFSELYTWFRVGHQFCNAQRLCRHRDLAKTILTVVQLRELRRFQSCHIFPAFRICVCRTCVLTRRENSKLREKNSIHVYHITGNLRNFNRFLLSVHVFVGKILLYTIDWSRIFFSFKCAMWFKILRFDYCKFLYILQRNLKMLDL